MAKGQKRSNREIKKPKQDKKKGQAQASPVSDVFKRGDAKKPPAPGKK
jgi:hypothetical protein